MNFLASPTVVTALAFGGKLSFNPLVDTLELPDGKPFKFLPPIGPHLPDKGFTPGEYCVIHHPHGFLRVEAPTGDMSYYPLASPEPQPSTEIPISSTSTRLEVLQPFPSHFGPSSTRGWELPLLKVLMRVRGKCTTDHISAAVCASHACLAIYFLSQSCDTGPMVEI
jgi:homoaconitase